MKNLVKLKLLWLVLPFIWSCVPQKLAKNVDAFRYSINSPVNFTLEPGAVFVFKTYNESLEKTTNGRFLRKTYYPTAKSLLIQKQYFLDEAMTTPDGLYFYRFDNGNFETIGQYENGQKEGEWEFYDFKTGKLKTRGSYKNGKPTGQWFDYHSDSTKSCEYTYNEGGKLEGDRTYWTKTGEKIKVITYKDGEKTKTEVLLPEEDTDEVGNKLPIFGNICLEEKDDEMVKKCSEKELLKHIFTNVRYPSMARENNIQGLAVFLFRVEKDGRVTNVQAIHGICDEIRDEGIRVIKSLPKFHPGINTKDGKPIAFDFNLPIRFKLQTN